MIEGSEDGMEMWEQRNDRRRPSVNEQIEMEEQE